MTSLLFGDVFRYNDNDYIYLAKTDDLTYAAQILNEDIAKRIEGLYKTQLSHGKMTPVLEGNILYCYVILQTKELKAKMAHFEQTRKDSTNLIGDKLPISLNKKDLKLIKEEIMSKPAIPTGLKFAVKDIRV